MVNCILRIFSMSIQYKIWSLVHGHYDIFDTDMGVIPGHNLRSMTEVFESVHERGTLAPTSVTRQASCAVALDMQPNRVVSSVSDEYTLNSN